MTNRWIRFLLAVVAIAAAAGAAYRVLQDERRLAADVAAMRAADFSAQTALTSIEELKAALHAYVAPGQGQPFWTARSAMLLDKLRSSILELDSAATASGTALGDSLNTSDRLAAAEQRAREYVRSGQALLAGDVIFNEARDLLDALRLQIARARDHIATAAINRQTSLRREQMWFIAGAVGILAFVMLLLVLPGRASEPDPGSLPGTDGRTEPEAPQAPHAPQALQAPYARVAPELAALCNDLAAVNDSRQIGHLVDTTAELLGARGVIVWLSSPDRVELNAVASSGYDDRVMARIGPIHREAGNLTAAAFRENAPRSSAATVSSAAALAVPLPSPQGAVGVLSAELRPDVAVQESSLAIARIVAAQLGALLGSIPDGRPEVKSNLGT